MVTACDNWSVGFGIINTVHYPASFLSYPLPHYYHEAGLVLGTRGGSWQTRWVVGGGGSRLALAAILSLWVPGSQLQLYYLSPL